jgi:hypothetical protein
MMTPEEGFQLQQERITALETALRGCLQQMRDADMGRRNEAQWAMACEAAEKVLNRPDVIY